MKLSLITSSAIIGLGLVSNASAKNTIYPNSGGLDEYFDLKTNGNTATITIKDTYANQELDIYSNVNDFVVDKISKENTSLYINTGSQKLTIENYRGIDDENYEEDSEKPTDTESRMYNANITASDVSLKDMNLEYYKNENRVKANVSISNSDEKKPKSSVMIINSLQNDNYNASLNITGNLDASNTKFYGASTNGNLNFNVGKNVNITDSKFFVLNKDLGNHRLNVDNLTLNRFVFMSTEKFNEDIATKNTAGASLFKRIDQVFKKETADKLSSMTNGSYLPPMDLKDLVDYKLSVEKNGNKEYLIISGGVTDKVNSIKAILEIEKEYLENVVKFYDLDYNSKLDPVIKDGLEDIKEQIENKNDIITKINENGGDESKLSTKEKMDALGIELTNTSKFIFEKASNLKTKHSNTYNLLLGNGANTLDGATRLNKAADSMQASGNINESQNIFNSLIASDIDPSVGVEAITHSSFFKDVRDSSRDSINILNNGSSINSAINISNDMSISKRVASINNLIAK